MLNRMALGFKLNILLAVFLIIGLINAAIIYTVINRQIARGRAINLAGRQRMLTQKMSKEALLLANALSSKEREKTAADLKETMNLFDTTLNGLLSGDEKLGLAAVSDDATRQKLLEVREQWQKFSANIRTILKQGRMTDTVSKALESIKAENIPLLKTMNEAVGLYEKNNNLGTVLVIQGVILLFLLCVTVTAWFLVQNGIIIPLKKASTVLGASSNNIDALSASVATAAENLADQATNQAAIAEESSAALEEITGMTRQNAEHTAKADTEMQQTKNIAEKANTFMEEMNRSMADILTAGEETQKIVKTIDEIAFQTTAVRLTK